MTVPYEFSAERFSRWVSYVLRHNPTRYGLEPDKNGYVDLQAFFAIAKKRYPSVDHDDLKKIIETTGINRFEMTENRLRARYGHSIAIEPAAKPALPPDFLYHGTTREQLDSIPAEGLNPSARRMIHLSESIEDAKRVAQRKTDQPAVICVEARKAHESGIKFYQEGNLYLSQHIPPQFLSAVDDPSIVTPTP